MKLLKLGAILLTALLVWSLRTGSIKAQSEAELKEMQKKATNYYDILYPNDTLKDWFTNNVGLEKGAGPWQNLYKPVPLQMYWFPERHYVKPDGTYYDQLLEKYKPNDCVKCHEEVTPGFVKDWEDSTHAKPKKNPRFAEKTQQIEKLIGRELKEVTCSDCHGKDHKELRMPTPQVCGECHPQQTIEFMGEAERGRPNHIEGLAANVIPPWYPEMFRRGYPAAQFGCDLCHATDRCNICHSRHKFAASEGRRPEACMSCHMGFDHPDAETYGESKMGYIYHMEGEHWDWEKPLAEVVPGKDYRTPTCQFCHFDQGNGTFAHNPVIKGVWRMGTVPPTGIDYKSSLKDYPFGINLPPMNYKLDVYSPENKRRSEQWVSVCSKCHSPRFARLYRENLNDFMFEMWSLQDRAQSIVDDIAANDEFDVPIKRRDIFPLGDILADALGPGLLGDAVHRAFKTTGGKVPVVGPILGLYGLFMTGKNNPSEIELTYANMWFGDAKHAYKGVAHGQQDIAWWYGAAKVYQGINRLESQAIALKRGKKVDEFMVATGRKNVAGIVGSIVGIVAVIMFGAALWKKKRESQSS
ncbi:Hydroxylamine oxidoreductase precursor [Candidatus Brocadiaceae bacterium B188]|nr:hydroxylamine oxidoreductase [Candidatus Brocadia sapporoensis]QQR67558.1 MAG: hydroxylamine oxidoreductase [Candidatus Brocadia sp.]RZV58960.1 MAG: hydroxylamine oxidoreductase [Candidatus Brocadia sp. BROELEC01]TWU52381.1 Hydroxylamine oxidoreductase precursor [Candidatus Brocadiaceae bacterium B188]